MRHPGPPTPVRGTLMNLPSPHAPRASGFARALLVCAFACASPSLRAQAAQPPRPQGDAEASGAPIAKPQGAVDETVLLNVFEVKADADDTYDATNTNSVTGTNTSLNKTPLDAKVFNRQVMDELNVVDLSQLLSDIGGLGAAYIGAGNEDMRGMVEGDRQDFKSMTSRGLTISNPRRDGFLRSDTSMMDSFDVERIEAIQGSNSLLFGSGDAGGVVTVGSKRALLRRNSLRITGTTDSEDSTRATFDANVGSRLFAVRVNAVKGTTRFFKPTIGQLTEGLQVAATVQPWKRLQIRGEWRHYTRDTILAQSGTVRAPTDLILSNGVRADNQPLRYILAQDNGQALLGNQFDLVNADSVMGVFRRDAYVNASKGITAELNLAKNLDLQVRYGHDNRVNHACYPTSTTIYHPYSTLNLYRDADGNPMRVWSMNTNQYSSGEFWQGARGYRAALVYRLQSAKLGMHAVSLFKQDMWSWTTNIPMKYYEMTEDGTVVQNLANIKNSESGRNAMPAVWQPIGSTVLVGGASWPSATVRHPNGKLYGYFPQVYPGAVPPTPTNPLGLSGPINATTGFTSNGIYSDDVRERAYGVSLFSSWWKGRIDTMIGFRDEEADTTRTTTGVFRGPIAYDGTTMGMVFDTPLSGVRGYVNYATNGKISFDTNRDIWNNPLPAGRGVSKEVGLKFSLWDHRLSGNVNYYISEAKNFTAGLGGARNDIDPPGINGRHGGANYLYSKTSDGFGASLSMKPHRSWQVILNFTMADGSERTDVALPTFYNDEFNTMTHQGQTVVAVKDAAGSLTPLLVPVDPANAESDKMALSVAMMKDPNSPYFAQLDPESGYILNAQALQLDTPGVGTTRHGLPLSDHQLGFVSPSGGTIVVRRAGEKTIGYPEQSFSLINRYQFSEGRLKGLVVGLTTVFQRKLRGYMYNDLADGNTRKMFYLPDRLLNNLFVVYNYRLFGRYPASAQLNVANLLDENKVYYMLRSSDGTVRYSNYANTPRKISVTTSFSF